MTTISSTNPLAYIGLENPENVAQVIKSNTATPTTSDYRYPIGSIWIYPPQKEAYILVNTDNNIAQWHQLSEIFDFYPSVLSQTTEALAVQTFGNRYIASANGATWLQNYIYEWGGVQGWLRTQPTAGSIVYDENLATYLLFDGANWGTLLSAFALGDLSDVTIAAVADNDVLTYDLGTTDWVNTKLVNANIDAAAAIDYSKLAALTSANILVGSAGNVATVTPVTGDISIDNTGLTDVLAAESLTAFSIRSSGAAFDMIQAMTEAISADRTLTWTMNDADRGISLAGDITTAGDFVTSGAFSLTLTTTALTNVTLPTTGTLATLNGIETFTNKTLTSSILATSVVFDQTTEDYTLTWADPAAARALSWDDPGGDDKFVFEAATQTLTNKTISVADIDGGTADSLTSLSIRSSGAAFDLFFATAEVLTANRTLNWVMGDADRTITLAGDITLAGLVDIDGDLTLNLGGPTTLTLPTTGSVATLAGIETFTNKTLTAPDINGGTVDNITSFGIRSSGAAFDISMSTSEVLTADRNIAWNVGDAARSITLGGNISTTGNFNTVGGDTVTFTTTGNSNVTLPLSGTLATLGNIETFTNKTLTSPVMGTSIVLDQTTEDYTILWADPAAARSLQINDPGGNDHFVFRDASQTLINKTLTSPVLNTSLSGTAFLDEDNMASNAADKVASQQSIKAYVDSGTVTFTNKTLDADGTGNSITNLNADELDPITFGNYAVPFVITKDISNSLITTIYSANAPFKFRILDAHVITTAAGNTGTWYLDDGTNSITAAISYSGSDSTIGRATVIDDAYWDIASAGTLRAVNSIATDDAVLVINAIRID